MRLLNYYMIWVCGWSKVLWNVFIFIFMIDIVFRNSSRIFVYCNVFLRFLLRKLNIIFIVKKKCLKEFILLLLSKY